MALDRAPTPGEIRGIIEVRCQPCHNAQTFSKNIQLHTPELIARNAPSIYQQVVVARTMPLGNATAMTEGERAALAAWVRAGAPMETAGH